MRNTKNKSAVTKQQLSKCKDVCRTYSAIQTAYANVINSDDSVVEFRCNVPLDDIPLTDGKYTTDFVAQKADGEIIVRECVKYEHIYRPKQIAMLDASREYWLARGIKDWGIVINGSK